MMWCVSLNAQNTITPNIGYIESIAEKSNVSIGDLTKAKAMIDLAIEREDMKHKSNTWYLRGRIYEQMFLSGNVINGVSEEKALQKSAQAYVKAAEFNETDIYAFKAQQKIEGLWANQLNNGVNSYNAGAFHEAVKHFQYCSQVKPADTTGYLYAASAATEVGDYPTAVANYKDLIKIYPKEDIYIIIVSLQKDYLGDLEAAYHTIQEAKQVFGDNSNNIRKSEIDLLISMNKFNDAIVQLEQAIIAEPYNPILYLKKGLLYDQLADNELRKDSFDKALLNNFQSQAEAAYRRTIELDPGNESALFNYAIIYNNKAIKYFKEVALMSPAEYNSRGKVLEATGINLLNESTLLMEKAREINPEDADILFALESMYTKLNNQDKLAEIKKKIEWLGLE